MPVGEIATTKSMLRFPRDCFDVFFKSSLTFAQNSAN